MSTAARIQPYEGTEPYIFISYSHRDYERVQPILRGLVSKGYRLWYDEGIDPGTEWPESIANHLGGSAVCLAFLSPHSASSRNCRREINFTLARNIELLTVFLEPTEISSGLEMQISTYQSIMGYTYPNLASLLDRIASVDAMRPCLGTPDVKEMAGGAYGAPAIAPVKKKRGPILIGAGLALAALAAGAWFLIVPRLKAKGTSASQTGPQATPEATAFPGIEATSEPEPEATAAPEPEATAEPTPDPTAAPTPEITAVPEWWGKEDNPYGYPLSYFATKNNWKDSLWDVTPISNTDPLPEGYRTLIYGEWAYGSLLVYGNDEGSLRFALTDERVPDGFPMSPTPGKNEAYWNVILQIDRGVKIHATIDDYEKSAISFANLTTVIGMYEKNTFSSLGGFPYSMTGNTFVFEMDLPEQYTTEDLYGVYVNLGTEQSNYTDTYDFYVE